MIYLASPYTHDDPAVREQRFRAACEYAAELMLAGVVVYSPIAHGHSIEMVHGEPMGDHAFWLRHCFGMLRLCNEVHILKLDGWDRSRGVTAERELAKFLSIRVIYADPDGLQP